MKNIILSKKPILRNSHFINFSADRKLHFVHTRNALLKVSANWYDVGQCLGVAQHDLQTIKQQNDNQANACLPQMIDKCFATGNVLTLERVVAVIATRSGGNNPAHAESVAQAFYGTFDTHIHYF